MVAPDDEDLDSGAVARRESTPSSSRSARRHKVADQQERAYLLVKAHVTIREKTWRLALPTNSASRGSRRASDAAARRARSTMPGLRNFDSVLLIVADAAAIKTASEITARVG